MGALPHHCMHRPCGFRKQAREGGAVVMHPQPKLRQTTESHQTAAAASHTPTAHNITPLTTTAKLWT